MIFTKIKEFIAKRNEDKQIILEEAEKQELLQQKKEKLIIEIDNLINNKRFNHLVKILENGYLLTEKQNNNINSIIGNLQSSDIVELVNAGYQLNTSNFLHIFNDSEFIDFHRSNIDFREQFSNKFKHDPEFSKMLLDSFNKNIKKISRLEPKDIFDNYTYTFESKANDLSLLLIKKMQKINKTIQFMENHWNKIITTENFELPIKNIQKIQDNFKCYSKYLYESRPDNIIKSFQNEIDTFFKKISPILENNSNNDIQQLLLDTKEVFSNENVEKNISKLSEKQISAFSIKKLPDNIQSIVLKIENNCQKLNSVKDVEVQHIITQTMDKLLPETLKKYSFMDDEYKNTMKNKDGKTAQDLLIESLKNMNDRLVNLIEDKNENQLLEMEIGATFIKKLKNS